MTDQGPEDQPDLRRTEHEQRDVKVSRDLMADGRHVLTEDVLRGLRTGRQRFEGAATCSGSGRNGSRGCTRVLRYVAIAGYRQAP